MLFRKPATWCDGICSGWAFGWRSMISRSRWPTSADRVDSRAYASAVISSDPHTNASTGNKSVTLHLDLHDLLDPEKTNRLHHNRRHDHHLPDLVLEQHLHVLGVDNRQRESQKRGQRQQHVAGEPAVRGVHAYLPADLESLANHRGKIVENLREVAARVALN